MANYIGRVTMGSVPVAAAPTTTKPNGGDEDMWAKALQSLPVEDQQEFKGLGGDMLGVLRGVSILSRYMYHTPGLDDINYGVRICQVFSPISLLCIGSKCHRKQEERGQGQGLDSLQEEKRRRSQDP